MSRWPDYDPAFDYTAAGSPGFVSGFATTVQRVNSATVHRGQSVNTVSASVWANCVSARAGLRATSGERPTDDSGYTD